LRRGARREVHNYTTIYHQLHSPSPSTTTTLRINYITLHHQLQPPYSSTTPPFIINYTSCRIVYNGCTRQLHHPAPSTTPHAGPYTHGTPINYITLHHQLHLMSGRMQRLHPSTTTPLCINCTSCRVVYTLCFTSVNSFFKYSFSVLS